MAKATLIKAYQALPDADRLRFIKRNGIVKREDKFWDKDLERFAGSNTMGVIEYLFKTYPKGELKL